MRARLMAVVTAVIVGAGGIMAIGSAVSAAEFPGQENTGVPPGLVLTPSGSVTAKTAGQVIEGLDVSGAISVSATEVIIRNSRISGSGVAGIKVNSGASVTIEDTEIVGHQNGIMGSKWKGTRLDIHNQTQDGVKFGTGTELRDSWIHNLLPEPGAHADGGQCQSACVGMLVVHNTIDSTGGGKLGNSAIFVKNDLGSTTQSPGPVTISNNYLNGGNFTLFVRKSGSRTIANITITDNVFGPMHHYGFKSIDMPVTASGNVDSNGQALNF